MPALLSRARCFFGAAEGAPAEVRAALARGGLGEMALRMGKGLVATAERHAMAQQRHAAPLSRGIESRAIAFETLDDWMRSFATAARVALRGKPELLAALGIKPRGRPRKATP